MNAFDSSGGYDAGLLLLIPIVINGICVGIGVMNGIDNLYELL